MGCANHTNQWTHNSFAAILWYSWKQITCLILWKLFFINLLFFAISVEFNVQEHNKHLPFFRCCHPYVIAKINWLSMMHNKHRTAKMLSINNAKIYKHKCQYMPKGIPIKQHMLKVQNSSHGTFYKRIMSC